MIDRLLSKTGVGVALLFIVLELSYINSKSLHYLMRGSSAVDTAFGIIGAIAFSMVTVLVMRLSDKKWLKVAFPLFDVALVFGGFNLIHADALTANPVRLFLTVFLALFTGLITYSLGQINAQQHEGENSADLARITDLTSRLNAISLKYDETQRINNELKAKQIESQRIADELKAKHSETKRNADELEVLASRFLGNHIRYESWLGKKKAVTNRNGYESAIEKLAERVKGGETITVKEYMKEVEKC